MAKVFEPLEAAFRGVYHNPVFPGDFPDPSVIRVGDAFYALTTSTDWAPFFPIFRSFDLVRWSIVGHVFAERPPWCVGNFWAPDLVERDGRFFVYYTARRADGPLCVAVATAERPEGPYVDHGPLVGQRCGSIDAMATEDEFGDRWLLWKEDGNSVGDATPLWAQRLEPAGTALRGEPVELFRNDQPWEANVVEAPHVMRRDGWFYMFYSGNACCGEDCAYAVGVARAPSLTGPWEKYAHNPILAGNDAFKCPGHGAPVCDAEGRWFYLYHAYEHERDGIFVGRQLCLDAIEWSENGWPSINRGRGPSRHAAAPFGTLRLAPRRSRMSANLAAPLDRVWEWPQSDRPVVTRDRRGTCLTPAHARRPDDPVAAVLARRTSCGDYAAVATLEPHESGAGTLASLCAYGTRRDAIGIGVRDGAIIVWRRRGGRFVELARAALPRGRTVHLRCTAIDGRSYRFAYGVDGRSWTTLGDRIDGAWLPPWDAGVRVALAVGGAGAPFARFRTLDIRPTPAPVTSLADRIQRLRRKFQERDSARTFSARITGTNTKAV